MLKYQLNMAKAEAIYTPQVRAMYQNNPWIEALPDNPDDKELFKILKGKIPYDAVERELPAYERRECVQSLSQVFVPWGKSGEIARKIYSAIRAGYVTRNPIEQAWMQEMSELQNCVNQKDAGFRSVAGTNANACGFCIVGDSGMEKPLLLTMHWQCSRKLLSIASIMIRSSTALSWSGCVWNVLRMPASKACAQSFSWNLIAF